MKSQKEQKEHKWPNCKGFLTDELRVARDKMLAKMDSAIAHAKTHGHRAAERNITERKLSLMECHLSDSILNELDEYLGQPSYSKHFFEGENPI